jgi:hypothetical protein
MSLLLRRNRHEGQEIQGKTACASQYAPVAGVAAYQLAVFEATGIVQERIAVRFAPDSFPPLPFPAPSSAFLALT